jgi:hypothetical protein
MFLLSISQWTDTCILVVWLFNLGFQRYVLVSCLPTHYSFAVCFLEPSLLGRTVFELISQADHSSVFTLEIYKLILEKNLIQQDYGIIDILVLQIYYKMNSKFAIQIK